MEVIVGSYRHQLNGRRPATCPSNAVGTPDCLLIGLNFRAGSAREDSLVLGNRASIRSSAVRDRVLDLVHLYVEVAAAVPATATCRLRIKRTLIWAQTYFTLTFDNVGAPLFGSISAS